MSFNRRILSRCTITTRVARLPRIILKAYGATPVDAGFGSSRFSSPTQRFRTLYAAQDFGTALAEAVMRDRFIGRVRKVISLAALEAFAVTEIHSKRRLTLLDLTGANAYLLGVNTDAIRGREHQPGQILAEKIVTEYGHDGVVYTSRITDRLCFAFFDTAIMDLEGTPAVPLLTVAGLAQELRHLEIAIRR